MTTISGDGLWNVGIQRCPLLRRHSQKDWLGISSVHLHAAFQNTGLKLAVHWISLCCVQSTALTVEQWYLE